jgi:RNA polymerase sigma-70 factor (ECF subfamily)
MSITWDRLAREHADRVYRLAYGLTRNRHEAEDLAQDVFDRVFRNTASYTHGNLDGWLYRITVNIFRDRVRRNGRLRLEPLREDTADDRSPTVGLPVFDDDVRAALAALHPTLRAAVLLFDVDGLNYDEIAAALGVKRGTVGSRIHRGRAQLRAALAHRAPRRRSLVEVDLQARGPGHVQPGPASGGDEPDQDTVARDAPQHRSRTGGVDPAPRQHHAVAAADAPGDGGGDVEREEVGQRTGGGVAVEMGHRRSPFTRSVRL